jgi:cation diffusion facilitator CzcD-associated flavoprotein CzcO
MSATPQAIIIGGGPAGLACAVALRQAGIAALILEKSDSVSANWRGHYDRLHLHTHRRHSGLPGRPMPASYPPYPSRDQVIAYLEAYAAHFGLTPRFGCEVQSVRRQGDIWHVQTSDAETLAAPLVVIATGIAAAPLRPAWAGLDAYAGEVLHSSAYKNPAPFAGSRVLVVGFGNSGGEIALDLANAGVRVTLSVRSAVQVLPRDLLGLSILSWSILYSRLPARLADAFTGPIIRLAVGDIERLGLRRAGKGPRQMVEEDGRIPLIDIGTLAKIREGAIAIRGAIRQFRPGGVEFTDGRNEPFDAVILATGFKSNLAQLLPSAGHLLDANDKPRVCGAPTAEPGLYFCGQIASATGQLREISREARAIANHSAKYLQSSARAAAS